MEIDAKNKVLGRLASEIAQILQGKNKPDYHPRLEGKEKVIVLNADKIKLTGKKKQEKIYYSVPAGYVGHLKKRTFLQIGPKQALRKAVYNMLPKNRLRAKRMKRLIIK